MSLYTVFFSDGKRPKKFYNSFFLSRYVIGYKFRSDVSDISIELI